MADKSRSSVFQGYEKVDTIYATKITRENIVALAEEFKGQIDWSGDVPVLRIINKYSEGMFHIGDWISDRGKTSADLTKGGWQPMGTYSGSKDKDASGEVKGNG